MVTRKMATSSALFCFSMFFSVLCLSFAGCDDSNLKRGKPLIEVTPLELDFGALNVGDSKELTFTISNVGTAALTVDSLTIDGDTEFTLSSVDSKAFDDSDLPLGFSIPGAGTNERDVGIEFSPREQRSYSAVLHVLSDDQNSPDVSIALKGSGGVPDIIVTPQLLDFGGVRLNSSASLALNIGNEGQAPLVIGLDGLSLQSGDDSSPFFWVAQDMLIDPGEQGTVEIIYSPKKFSLDTNGEVIPDEDVLLLESNDPDDSPVAIPLSGHVSDNLPPVASVSISSITKLDGSAVDDLCAPAPVDTITFLGRVHDPDGSNIQGSDLTWTVEAKPNGSTRDIQVPSAEQDRFQPSFRADLSGEYTVCLKAKDPEGNMGSYDPSEACDCQTANAAEDFSCPCIKFSAFPREDMRIELTWDMVGPDLDLHLVAPSGDFCSPTRECRYNPLNPDDPDWTRVSCVDSAGIMTCREPNCDAVAAGCADGQECYDDGAGPHCWWGTCSGSDCFWNARQPDWGVAGDTSDDPLLAIDCTRQCRAENINLNKPVPGIYTVMVNYFEYRGNTTATVRIYFKGDVVPTAEFQTQMTEECDRWNVALIDWVDHENHTVTSLGESHSLDCCQ